MTLEDIKFLASHIRDGQQDAANQIIAALRGSNRDYPGDDPDDEGAEPGPSHPRPRRRPASKKDKGVKPRSPFENSLSVSCHFRWFQPLTQPQREIRTYLIDELVPSDKWLTNTVTSQDLDDFNAKIGECCTANNFRIHLAGTPGDSWNKSATRVLVNSFLEAHKQYDAQNTDVRDMVMKKCSAAVAGTIKKYKWGRKHRTENSRRLELDNKSRAERKRSVRGIRLILYTVAHFRLRSYSTGDVTSRSSILGFGVNGKSWIYWELPACPVTKKRRWEEGNSGGSLPLGGGRPGLPDGSVISTPSTTWPGVRLPPLNTAVRSLVIVQVPEGRATTRHLFADSLATLTEMPGSSLWLMSITLSDQLRMYLGLTSPQLLSKCMLNVNPPYLLF